MGIEEYWIRRTISFPKLLKHYYSLNGKKKINTKKKLKREKKKLKWYCLRALNLPGEKVNDQFVYESPPWKIYDFHNVVVVVFLLLEQFESEYVHNSV